MTPGDLDRKKHWKLYYDEQPQRYATQRKQVPRDLAKDLPRLSGAAGMPFYFQRAHLFTETVEEEIRDTNTRVLDYGCGDGRHGLHRALLGKEVVGIDISSGALGVAKRETARESGRVTLSYVAGDCEQLPFQDNSFDIVFQSGTFSFLNLEKSCQEIARVLKTTGHFISVDTLGENPVLRLANKLRESGGARLPTRRRLRLRDMNTVRQYFGQVEVRLFDIMTLPIVALKGTHHASTAGKIDRITRQILWTLDGVMTRIPIVQRLAFNIVWVASEPINDRLGDAGGH